MGARLNTRKRGRPTRKSEWRPKQAGGLGRREDGANFTLLRACQAARPHSARAAASGRSDPGSACVTAALQHFSPGTPYSPVPSSGPRIPSWGRSSRSGQFRVEAPLVHPGQPASRPGNLPAFRSPPPGISPSSSTGLVAAERRLPMGALFPLPVTDHWANPRAVAGGGAAGAEKPKLKRCGALGLAAAVLRFGSWCAHLPCRVEGSRNLGLMRPLCRTLQWMKPSPPPDSRPTGRAFGIQVSFARCSALNRTS